MRDCNVIFVNVLIRMIESWQKCLDSCGNGIALLTDLSKTVAIFTHEMSELDSVL